MNTVSPQAKPEGVEYCTKCKDWRKHDSAGDCYGCGRKLIRESSTFDRMAELASKGYFA